ncbi:MAG: GNAT family N-acetyltransferase [Candidatus Aenigmarchaeota archaeon]|nr:GNAT family N-acetyltransferase [Candidatus Aenigmarchaeota archaeon]
MWNKFSPNRVIWDLWDISFSFFDENVHKPYFILIKNEKEEGILPLWWDNESKEYRYFGGGFTENRSFWFDLKYFSVIFEAIPEGTKIYDINEKSAEPSIIAYPHLGNFVEKDDFRYFLNIEKLNSSFDEYLKTLSNTHRKKFRQDIKKIENIKHSIEWCGNECFDDLVRFNVKRFGDQSDLSDRFFTESLNKLFSYLEKEKMLQVSVFKINEEVEGIQYAAFYEGIYYVIQGGYNLDIKNLGKFLITEQIKRAISLNAKEIDFMCGEKDSWKALWNFETEQYYNLKKQPSMKN